MTPEQTSQKKSEIKTKSAIYGLLAVAFTMISLSFFAEAGPTTREILSLIGTGLVVWMVVFIISRRILYRWNGFKIPRPPSP